MTTVALANISAIIAAIAAAYAAFFALVAIRNCAALSASLRARHEKISTMPIDKARNEV